MPEILRTHREERHAQPLAIEILNVAAMSTVEINAAVARFVKAWEATHVCSAPSYVIGSQGEERLYLQATCRVLWLEQNEQQGIAAARQQAAGAAEMKRLSEGVVRLATPMDFPGVKPRGGGVGRGMFPAS